MNDKGEEGKDAKVFVEIVSKVGKDETLFYFGKDDPISWWIKKRDDWEDAWFIWHSIHPELWHRMTGLPAFTAPPPLPDPLLFNEETPFDSVIRILKSTEVGEHTAIQNDKDDEVWVVGHDAGGFWGVKKTTRNVLNDELKRSRKD